MSSQEHGVDDPPSLESGEVVRGLVTVVIPTRDHLHRLRSTLPTALDQRKVDVEVVVVDDGSSDGTAHYLADQAANDSRVRVVRHPSGRGVASARNRGIDAARGEWIALLDDDDLWSPDKVRFQLDAMQMANASWAYAAVMIVDADFRPVHVLASPEPAEILPGLLVSQEIPAGSSNVIARTDLLRSLNGFDEAFAHLADWDLWIRLAGAAPPARCPEVLLAYVEHPDAMHVAPDIERVYDELAYLERKHRRSREPRGLAIDMPAMSTWIASGHLRAGRRWPAFRVHVGAAFRYRDIQALRRALRVTLPQRPLRPWRLPPPPAAPPWLALRVAQETPLTH